MTLLDSLLLKYGSDKTQLINHGYGAFYDFLFRQNRFGVKKMLEVGIGFPETMSMVKDYKRGASLYAFRDFFPNAEIHAIDIREDTLFQDERILTYKCDQSQPDQLRSLADKIGEIDIVIEDGSHLKEHQVISCITLLPFVKQWYIIEDVSAPDWVQGQLALVGIESDVVTFNPWAPDDRLIIIQKK